MPSNSKTYTSSEIVAAISDSFGQDPVLLCDDDTLSSIYYGFFVNGPLMNEDFVPASVVGEDSSCPSSGISYPPKSGATTTVATTTVTTLPDVSTQVTETAGGATATATTTKATTATATSTSTSKKITLPGKTSTTTTATSTASTTSSAATATGSSVSGEGYWYAYYDGEEDGCLISGGTWYTTGTCATYHATESGTSLLFYSVACTERERERKRGRGKIPLNFFLLTEYRTCNRLGLHHVLIQG